MLFRLGMFRRSREVERLDFALRSFGVDARTVPDAVKFTVVKLIKDMFGVRAADEPRCLLAAALLSYCIMGDTVFAEVNEAAQLDDAERRLEQALADPDGADAKLILLTLHAGLVHPDIVARYDLAAD